MAKQQRPQRLYSYIVRVDDGAAPNPYHRMCTLAICKPAIRRTAAKGDWIIGTGSSAAGLAGKLIYAMYVDDVITLKEYDRRAPGEWNHRLPDPQSDIASRRRGDCIYDYSRSEANPFPRQRPSVHNEENRDVDLGGRNVLISRQFIYYGGNAIDLPIHLQGLVHTTQGHKWKMNSTLLDSFVKWFNEQPRGMVGAPGFVAPEAFWKGKRGCIDRCSAKDDGQSLCIRKRPNC